MKNISMHFLDIKLLLVVNKSLVNKFFKILGRRFDEFVPLIYVLSARKDANTYVRIFENLKEKQPALDPKHIMVDFERAAMLAISAIFPAAEIHGCFFHFSQCIWRKIQQCGLATKYQSDPEFAARLRYLPALAFFPCANVQKSFNDLKELQKLPKRPRAGTDECKLRQLFDYFEETWVGKGKKPPRFPHSVWNMRSLTLNGLPRTNNAVEGWHNAMANTVSCANPTIWKFIDAIKFEQGRQELRIAQMTALNADPPRRRYVNLALEMHNTVKAHENNPALFKFEEFLARMAHNLSF